MHICNLNKATKISIAKTQQKTFSQIIITLNKIIYVSKIRINYFEHLKLVKQKTINKINKFCQVIKVISRVLTMQYKREAIDKNI